MTVLLTALCATLSLVVALLAWQRAIVFWLSVTALAGCTLTILVIAGRTPAPDFAVVWAFVFLGPLAVVLSLLRLRALTRNLFMTVVTAVVAFVCAIALWAIVAVNVGALAP
jgi:hypothetical protein